MRLSHHRQNPSHVGRVEVYWGFINQGLVLMHYCRLSLILSKTLLRNSSAVKWELLQVGDRLHASLLHAGTPSLDCHSITPLGFCNNVL